MNFVRHGVAGRSTAPTLSSTSMIETPEEFRRLRESENPEEYRRASHDVAPVEVWLEVIRRWPDMRFWVAQNKTVPVSVLEVLADDPDETVRDMVLRKGSWRRSQGAG